MAQHRKGPPTDTLIAEYRAGATTTELAAKYSMHHTAIGGRLRRAGVEIRPARARALYDNGPQVQEAIRLYCKEGISMATIARRLGTSHSTVQRALAEFGVATRPHGLMDASIVIPTSQTDLAYMAGLFDGEGNLQFAKGRPRVGCKIAVYSTTSEVMNWVHDKFGGSLRWDHKRTKVHGWKPIGIWELYRAQDVGRLLAALLPYLIIKRALALDALRLFEKELHLTFPTHNDPVDPR